MSVYIYFIDLICLYLFQLQDHECTVFIKHEDRRLRRTELSNTTSQDQHAFPDHPFTASLRFPCVKSSHILVRTSPTVPQQRTYNCLHIPQGLAGGLISVATAKAATFPPAPLILSPSTLLSYPLSTLIFPSTTTFPRATLSAHVPTG